ncbi:hypothetical protein [Halanaerobium congolense]|jgi:hypothetical protein|uniref:hypothetical protein n=1 Tax=Halanaerobium congolense TaxID=54121 RepID=UPI00088E72ED|nr:hypothetical protein [Halanaerobium congolense]SDH60926.1 hypothetical protein SAMN04515651_11836 [Halanaerobium congolense]
MDDLYYFYKTKVNFKQIIFSEINIKLYSAFSFFALSSIILILLMVFFSIKSTYLISVISLCTIACIILGYYLNNKAKATLITSYKNRCNKDSLGKFDYIGVFYWNNNIFKKIQKKLLKDYLEEQLDIDFSEDIDKIENLINLSYKKAERSKISLSLFKKGGILVAFTPIWVQYLTWIYNRIDNFDIVTNISLKISFILIVLILMLIFIKIIITEFFNTKSLRYRNIGRLLEEISFDYIIKET